jgi:hypothetical protein
VLNDVLEVLAFSAVIPGDEAIGLITATAHIPRKNVPSRGKERVTYSEYVRAVKRSFQAVRDNSKALISALIKSIEKEISIRCF